ncbi:MAG: hypothetical protein MR384_00505 [Lachnospiraceae bacterium]|nr:hypothetical protein [Lachnospiraceae bacterium]
MSKVEKINELIYNENIYLENNVELFVYLYSYFSLYEKYSEENGIKHDAKTILISASVSAQCVTFLAEKVKISIEQNSTLPFSEEVMQLDFTPRGGSSYPIRCLINNDMFSETFYVKFQDNGKSIIPTMILSCYDELVLRVDPVPEVSISSC